MKYFYDTCTLLALQDKIFDSGDFYISSITYKELENIKSSNSKAEDVRFNARHVLHLLDDNEDKFEMIIFKDSMLEEISEYGFSVNDDLRIIASAVAASKNEDIIFNTADLQCRKIAESIGLTTIKANLADEDTYTGYKEIELNEAELANFYSNDFSNNINTFNLLENEYLLLTQNEKVIDKYVWRDGAYKQVPFRKFESKMFGKITPKDGDIYQLLAMDSLCNNQLTVIRGKAGSGKSLIGLAYLFQELERGTIEKIVMFVNPVATKDSCKFGLTL